MSARQCGGCTLCCTLTPVRELNKGANVRCQHQRFAKGCAIYAKRPISCRLWSCEWLVNPDDTADMRRPDRVGYVVDMMPDYVTLEDDGRLTQIPVVQIWLSPRTPDAHRDPALRRFLALKAERDGMAALARVAGDSAAVAIFAPAMTSDGQWHEQWSNMHGESQHTAAQVLDVMAQTGAPHPMLRRAKDDPGTGRVPDLRS